MNRKRTLAGLVLAVLLLSSLPTLVAAQTPRAPVEDHIWEALQVDGQAEILVVLKAQADLEGARLLRTKEEKGAYVYEQLTAIAAKTQPPLRARLDKMGLTYRSYWIQNMFMVEATSAAQVNALAAWSEVDYIEYYYPPMVDIVPVPAVPDSSQPEAVEWNITRVGAPDVWALGITGAGAVIGDLDTGVQWDHPALVNQYRPQIPGAPSRHDYNWYDGGYTTVPTDYDTHGTHTMGTIVGDDGAGNQIGMAPGADWIACPGIGSPYVGPFECFQFFMAPTRLDGTVPRTDLAPHVISNSWSSAGTDFHQAIYSLYMAGIYFSKSAGNTGSACRTITNPGQWPEVTAAAAFASGDTIASFSSRGPVLIGRDEFVKPDIAAPGVNVRSSVPGNGYTTMQGTSMACPHVTGAVALLISADPSLAGQIDTLQYLLKSTAEPKTSAQCSPFVDRPNDVWGWGILDIHAAVLAAQGLPGLGWLEGTVTDATTTGPVEGARIVLEEDSGGWTFLDRYTGATGYYSYTALPASTYHVTATAYGYLPAVHALTIQDGLVTTQNIPLTAAPIWTVSGHVTDASSGDPLAASIVFEGTPVAVDTDPATGFYTADVAEGEYWMVVRSPGYADEAVKLVIDADRTEDFALNAIYNYWLRASGGDCGPVYGWIDATDGTAVPLGDDAYATVPLGRNIAFYGSNYGTIYIGSNGIATFNAANANKWPGAIPDPTTPNNGIYAFPTDLNPNNGSQGNIYRKWVGDTLVIEWHQVQHYPSGYPETFEILIDANTGLVTIQYAVVSAWDGINVGVENAAGTAATAYGGSPAAGLALAFYPAYATPPWQGSGSMQGLVVDANSGSPLAAALVEATNPSGAVFSTTTGVTGTYSLDLCSDFYRAQASAAGYSPSAVAAVTVQDGQATTQEFALAAPVIVPPAPIPPVSINPGGEAYGGFTIANTGTADLDWSLVEIPTASWLAVAPISGVIAPGGSAGVLLTYTAPITTGVYTTVLRISSNDPVTPEVDVPVEMDVVAECTPVAIASITPEVAGCQVAFSAVLTGTAPFTYLWAFGDGVTSTMAMPTHTYTQTGTYSGTLEVENCGGAGYDLAEFTVQVTCAVPQHTIYLPVLFKGYAP